MKNLVLLYVIRMTKLFTYAFLVQLLSMSFLFAWNGNAQVKDIEEVMITLSFDNTKIEKAFYSIEKMTGFNFVHTDMELKDVPRVNTFDKDTQSVYSLLSIIGQQTGLYFKQVNQNIHVRKADNLGQEILQKPNNLRDDIEVSGIVTDASGAPIPGATVSVPGSAIGTATDLDGKYVLEVPEGSVLVFSFIGFESQRIEVSNQSVIDVVLNEDLASLEEVVVVGYGTQQKSHLTGSVGSLEMDEELSSRPMVEFGQALYGKIAGVQVINSSGRPGGSSTIQIRGINSISANSSPLIVIDGIPLPNYDLNLINPSDIESIEILKDAASAAIYGSRGANGVVLVTTKSGKSGKGKVNINYSYGLQEKIDKIKVMNSAEYAQASIDAAQNGWLESGGDPNAPNTVEARGHYKYTWPEDFNNPENLPNTDWQDLIFRVAPMQRVDVNVSGGNENTNYLISGGYVNQEGIVINSDYKKYSLNLKVSSKVTDWAEVGAC